MLPGCAWLLSDFISFAACKFGWYSVSSLSDILNRRCPSLLWYLLPNLSSVAIIALYNFSHFVSMAITGLRPSVIPKFIKCQRKHVPRSSFVKTTHRNMDAVTDFQFVSLSASLNAANSISSSYKSSEPKRLNFDSSAKISVCKL